MKRETLINRLVARNMKANGKGKAQFCVCMVRKLCFASSQRSANRKN